MKGRQELPLQGETWGRHCYVLNELGEWEIKNSRSKNPAMYSTKLLEMKPAMGAEENLLRSKEKRLEGEEDDRGFRIRRWKGSTPASFAILVGLTRLKYAWN